MALNGTLRDLLREAAVKAPVPIGSLLLVYSIVAMFLGHLTETEARFIVLMDQARGALEANTAAMQALVIRVETATIDRQAEHDRIQAILERRR